MTDPGCESVDSDVDLRDPAERGDTGRRERAVLLAVAAGGVLGAEARYGLSVALPHTNAAWPWATLLTNVVGSLLLGVLMVIVLERATAHHLVRPFLGVGVLGGFTTFSTFTADTQHLEQAHRPFVALGYLAASLAGCFVATAVGIVGTRAVVPEHAA